ncbi:MAG: chemotaxis-specific protein-glutamate methyltransferase CheB [Proteobacteria bacterium]|nr:chemotaxis-specific protein-glutamate methyltransferase CheB [Pseudomonadota bacterium]
MIKVLIVDDSLVQQELLTYILNSDPDIQVVGTAQDGEEAIRKVAQLKPDLVTMDIHMPKMTGIEATRIIMTSQPLPIVIISGSSTKQEVSHTFQAIEAGALCVLDRATFTPESMESLRNTIKLMAEIKVVRRYIPKMREPLKIADDINTINLIAIGASTGGPMALQSIFMNLNKTFPPILVVQHISAGFLEGLTEWLSQSANVSVKVASHHEEACQNTIYLAPDGFNMGIDSFNKIILNPEKKEHEHCPSVSYLFHSVAKYKGSHAMGILLTGMGKDGADGLKRLKEVGAVTVVQDQESSVVYGMPGEALVLDSTHKVLNPQEIAYLINNVAVSHKT